MSSHVNLLPGVIPLDKARKPERKRKVRKGLGGISQTGEIDDIEEIFTISEDGEEDDAVDGDDSAQLATGSVSGWFSGPTMKALLQAQEDAS